MTQQPISRRGFGRIAGAAGAGVLLGGAATASPALAAERTWHKGGDYVVGLKGFDAEMKTFMQRRDIPAGELAVTYKGRLVLARSYAWTADESLRFGPTALFRVASLSKPVTAAAMARLVQDTDLRLNTPITDLLDLTPLPGQQVDPRMSEVTVERLMQHLGGWDSDISGDPMFDDRKIAEALGKPLPVGVDDIITYMSGRELDHDPGSTYAYSNYGYLLLGRILEKFTGQDYRSFVQQQVLDPMGITRMKPGRARRSQSAENEVPYFSQYEGTTVLDDSGATVPRPYGTFNLENHRFNGGWLASATDLVRFAALFDSPSKGVLDASAIGAVFSEPETGVNGNGSYCGLGWFVRPVEGGSGHNDWHFGSLPGTYSLLVRTSGGMSWAALFDQRDDPSGRDYSAIDGALWDAADTVRSWPSHDLYSEYF